MSFVVPLGADGMSKRTHNDYQKLEKLGEGTFGVVHKARHIETGEVVALKKMRLEDEEDGVPATALREIAILRELKHPNVIECAASPRARTATRPHARCHSSTASPRPLTAARAPPCKRRLQHVFHTEKSLYLAFEFCDSDLKQYMRSIGNKLLPAQVQSYCWQLLNGLTWCHSHRIFHRDLKPQNLLVQPARGVLKIGDFGLTRAFALPLRSYTHEVVTLWYRAPEILLGAKDYACPIDMWSVGCVLGEMSTGRPMFPGDSEIDEIFKIFQLLGTPTPEAQSSPLPSPSLSPSSHCCPRPRRDPGTPSESVWEGVSKLADWQTRFPAWRRQNLKQIYHALGDDGVDLLEGLLQYDPRERIVGKDALVHAYFDTLDRSQLAVCRSPGARLT